MSQLQRSIPRLSLLISYLIVTGVVSTNFTMTNNCMYTVWPGISSNYLDTNTTGWALQQGGTRTITVQYSGNVRIWGRTYCTQNSTTGAFSCVTGDCSSGKLECPEAGATPPVTMAEFALASGGGQDYYDVSLVDGYNLPILVAPQGRSAQNCSSIFCGVDLNNSCPSEFQVTSDEGGGSVACKSACDAFQLPQYCCTGDYSSPTTCKPSNYSEIFKKACPAAYSYPLDDKNTTFTCSSPDYQITFCPSSSISSQPAFGPSPTIGSQPAFGPSPTISSQPGSKTASEYSKNKNNERIIVISGVVGSVVVVILVGMLLFVIIRRKRAVNPGKAMEGSIIAIGHRDIQNGTNNFLGKLEVLVGNAPLLHDTEKRIKDLIDSGDFDEEDKKCIDVHSFEFDFLVAATDDFSDANKLGRGGFGSVYKGRFPGGQETAIKRLSSVSGQGLEEFKNEVLLIAKLQHRNLVRLLGYCFKGDEKILVYEYLPNKSLDFFLFDEKPNALLNWEVRFNIILGIARGLLYLHQDSRLRIVHRDLKTSNILLDKELNPKISDFGLAKIVEGNNNEGCTTRVVGTYGYMSPEYALDGLFSVKSDVFSFGVVVLEILSGKKNNAYFKSEDVPSLLGYAWKLWREDKPLELMDENLRESFNAFEFLKCMNVALLCIQDDPADRPDISNVIFILNSETEAFPIPKQPAFFARGGFTTSTVNRVLLFSSISEEEKETYLKATSGGGK